MRPRSVAAWKRARVVSSRTSEASTPTAGRTSIRATARRRIPVAPEHVADASPVAPAERDELVTGRRPDGMDHDERRVVLDPGAGAEGAHEVVDLLPRAEARIRPEPERLVELPDLLDDRAAHEDRGRGSGVPHVVLHPRDGALSPSDRLPDRPRPRGGRRRHRAPRPPRSARRPAREARRVAAVVVGEPDEIGLEQAERGVPGARQPGRRAHALDPERRVRGEQRGDPIVVVLVDDEHARRADASVPRASRGARRARPSDRRSRRRDRRSGARLRAPAQATLREAMSPPLVSVVLAARDARATIGQAVASVLGQTLRDLELVVVDDGSVDGTGELLARCRRPAAPRRAERGGRSASPARSTSGSASRAGATSRASTRTTSRVRRGSSGSRHASAPPRRGRRRDRRDRLRGRRSRGSRPSDAVRGPRRALGGALLVAVLPPDGDGRPSGARRARAPVRHVLRRERGLRPLVAPPRGRGRRQPPRAARPLPAAPGAGVDAPGGRPARLPAAGRARGRSPSSSPGWARSAPSSRGSSAPAASCPRARPPPRPTRSASSSTHSSAGTAAARPAGPLPGRSRPRGETTGRR